jgi:predicted PurR-regulated permease PerM
VTAVIVVAVVVAVNQIEGDVLAPIVLGRSLRLHPLAILLALAAGTILAGIVGAILAVPFAAVAWSAVKAWRELSGRRASGALDEEALPVSEA